MTQPIQKAGSISCGAVWAVWSNADVKVGVSSCRPLICARNTFFRLCRGMWLFHIHSTVDIQLFFSFPRIYSLFLQRSPWRNFWLRHFVGYSFGTSRKKHQPLPMAQQTSKNGTYQQIAAARLSLSKDVSPLGFLSRSRYGHKRAPQGRMVMAGGNQGFFLRTRPMALFKQKSRGYFSRASLSQ